MKRSRCLRTYSRFAFSGTRALPLRTHYFCAHKWRISPFLSLVSKNVFNLSRSRIRASTCEVSLYSARIRFVVRSPDANSSYGALRAFRCLNAIVDSDKNASSRVCSLSWTIEIGCNLTDLLYSPISFLLLPDARFPETCRRNNVESCKFE